MTIAVLVWKAVIVGEKLPPIVWGAMAVDSVLAIPGALRFYANLFGQ